MATTIEEMLGKKKKFKQNNKKTFLFLHPKLPNPSCWAKPHLKRCCKFLLL
jgi:hypothetical protein